MDSDQIQLASIITVIVLFSQGGSYSSQNYGGSQVSTRLLFRPTEVFLQTGSMMANQYPICNVVILILNYFLLLFLAECIIILTKLWWQPGR